MPGKRQGHTLRRLKTTSTAGEGGPVSQRTPQDELQSLSDGTVNNRTGLADVGGRTGENDIGKLGEGGYSLQMRVAHLVQQHQRLLELGNPALEHLFTEGGRANRAAKEGEPLTGDRDLRWQWGERRNAALAGQRGGTCLRRGGGQQRNRGAVPLHDVECNREVPRRAHQETKLIGLYAVASAHNNSFISSLKKRS